MGQSIRVIRGAREGDTNSLLMQTGMLLAPVTADPSLPVGQIGFWYRSDLARWRFQAASGQIHNVEIASAAPGFTPVTVLTTSALAANTYNAAAQTITFNATGTQTINGVQLAAGMRVGVFGEGSSNNGIYDVTVAPAVGVAGVLTRSSDAASSNDWTLGKLIPVSKQDTTNGGQVFTVSNTSAITLDTTTITVSAQIDAAVTFAAVKTALAGASSAVDFNGQALTGLGGLTLAANANVSCAAGTTAVDYSSGTGAFKTTTGTNTLSGNVSVAAGKNLSMAAGTGAVDLSGATGTFATPTGAHTINGAVTLAANKGITWAAGTGGLDASVGTGDFKASTGALSWAGASGKAASIVASGAAITITADAASTWQVTTGALTENAAGGINLQKSGATLLDIGVTSATACTLSANTALSAAAGTGAVDFSAMTGTFKTGQGNVTLGNAKMVVTGSSGIISTYNNETTDGTGVAYIEKKGTDVASSGAGAQNTTIATFTPAVSGLYRVTIVMSQVSADTVSAQVTFTDAVNTTAETLTPISSVAGGTNSTTSASVLIRANTSTPIVAKISLSSFNTTKASATIERLN